MSATSVAAGDLPPAATVPTMYFIGVTTGSSSIRTVFPRWAVELGLGDVELVGIDLPLHAPREQYRRAVRFIARDPLSLGALVTTHKIDLYEACADLFDDTDPLASLMREVSCLSKRDGALVAHAKDPISSGLALEAFVEPGHWQRTGAQALVMGAGGSAIAISYYLARRDHGADRPSRIVVCDRDAERLRTVRQVHADLGADLPVEAVLTGVDGDNDALLADMPAGSLAVNATGLGKDAPGSPLSSSESFPPLALAWDLNYRGDLVFLDQARAAQMSRGVLAVDGWTYFLHGWTQHLSEVFAIDIPTSGPTFEALGRIAAQVRR